MSGEDAMFDSLQSRLGGVFDKLRGRGALTEGDVDEALKEVRTALIEADVELGVVEDFIARVRPRAEGEAVIRSVTPAQQVVKIVHDCLIEMLGSESVGLTLGSPPAPILMVGLQGSGKTTTTAKLGLLLQTKEKKRVLMASLDVNRPAAMEQLKILGEQAGVPTLPIVAGQTPLTIAKRALASARVGGYDVLILDTAGRQHVDDELMAEAAAVREDHQPARNPSGRRQPDRPRRGQYRQSVPRPHAADRHYLDAGRWRCPRRRGALHARGHRRADQIPRHGRKARCAGAVPSRTRRGPHSRHGRCRVAGRKGHRKTIDKAEAEKMAAKLKKGSFDMNDLADQLRQMKKMGGLQGLMGMLPGVGKIKDKLSEAGMDDRVLTRQEAIIGSMTKAERANPDVINGSRRKRIARGCGLEVSDVNKLMKMHRTMSDALKAMKKGGRANPFAALMGMNRGGPPPGFMGRH
jgi:signal recognition particle subunit SRP54